MTSARCGPCPHRARDPGPGRLRGRGGCPGSPCRAAAAAATTVLLLHLATCLYAHLKFCLYTYELFSKGIKISSDYIILHSNIKLDAE